MPEGDTIHRAAASLRRALEGRAVTRFDSVYPHLTRVDEGAPIAGRTIQAVEARGKHLLIWFSGDLVLRTHMRMHGSWHIYRPGERWQRPRHAMRIAIETDSFVAVGFDVPIAEFCAAGSLERTPLGALGPDPLDDAFDAAAAVARIMARGDLEIADALLDQSAIAGIGNVYKSEVLFAAGIDPFAPVSSLSETQVRTLVGKAVRFMRANLGHAGSRSPMRRTTGRLDPAARLWVYGRGGQPCRRCGTPIQRRAQGTHARSTYWCGRCQKRE
jgi:endonuclease-8